MTNAIEDLKAEAIQLAESRDLKRDYRKIFLGSKEGRRVLNDLVQYTGVLRTCFVPGDPVETARADAKREIGIILMNALDIREFDDLIEAEKEISLKLIELGETNYE